MSNSKNPYEVLRGSHVLSIWLVFKESQVHILKAWGFTTVYLLLLAFPSAKVIPLDTCSNEKSTLGKKPLQSSPCSQLKSSVNSCFSQQRTKNVTIKRKNLYRVKSWARESIPVNPAVRTHLFIYLFRQNQVQPFLLYEAEGYCF